MRRVEHKKKCGGDQSSGRYGKSSHPAIWPAVRPRSLYCSLVLGQGAVYLEACRQANLVDHNIFVNIRKSNWQLPEYVRGAGVSADGANTIVAHNLFLNIEGFAVSMNDRQPGRKVGGSPIEPQGHRVLNNVFADCRQPIFLAKSEGSASDGNLFDAGQGNAVFGIQYPEPNTTPHYAEWQKTLGLDAHSSAVLMEASFDPATMMLRFTCHAIQATSPAVPELGGATDATVCPGPFDRAECRRLGEGQTVTLSWPAPTAAR